MNLIKYSEYFKFENNNVEFSYGLLIENDEFIISYSINDRTTNIIKLHYEYIKNLNWTICNDMSKKNEKYNILNLLYNQLLIKK